MPAKVSFLLALFFTGSVSAAGVDPRPYWYNRNGIKATESQQYSDASTDFGEALRRDPLAGEIHYNLGLAFLAKQEAPKAFESFRLALEYAQNDETRFRARFNMGVLLTSQKKWEEALEQYQEALRINPSSFETKINIEMLVAQRDQDEQKKEQDQKDQDKKDQEKKDQEKDQDKKDGKGDKDEPKKEDEKGKGDKDKNEPDKGKEKDKKPGEYEKPKPQEFKSQDLTPGDVNKILDEIKQQEQRIRAEFQRKESKERPREKPW